MLQNIQKTKDHLNKKTSTANSAYNIKRKKNNEEEYDVQSYKART